MKKYWVAIVLLAAILTGIMLHIRQLEQLHGELTARIDAAETLARDGRFPEAQQEVRRALALWQDAEDYTHVFIRHSELDALTDALCELLGALGATDPGACSGSFEKLRSHLGGLVRSERITSGNIF